MKDKLTLTVDLFLARGDVHFAITARERRAAKRRVARARKALARFARLNG